MTLSSERAVGAGVAGWASFWRFEEGAVTSVPECALFAAMTTDGYAAGLALGRLAIVPPFAMPVFDLFASAPVAAQTG